MYNPYPYNLEISNCQKVEDLYYIYYEWCKSNNVEIRLGARSIYHEFMHIVHKLGVSPIEETKVLIVQRYYFSTYNVPSLNTLISFWQDSTFPVFLWPSVRELQDCSDWFNMYSFNKFNRYHTKSAKRLIKKAEQLDLYIRNNKMNFYLSR